MEEFGRHTIIEGSEIASLFSDNFPVKIEEGGLFLCTSGEADLVIDMKQYKIKKGDLMVCFPYSVIQVISHSSDCDGSIISATSDFFNTLEIGDRASFFLNIKDNPCITLTADERDKLAEIYDRIVKDEDKDHPFRVEINESFLRVMGYEIAAIYLKRKPILGKVVARKQMIFQQFIYSLLRDNQKQRNVEFYASEQSITPRHFSLVIKEVSGLTASEWIANSIITDIKSRLYDKSVTILQISDEFDFPNPSFFSQYFKKHTGMTPREFRKSLNS